MASHYHDDNDEDIKEYDEKCYSFINPEQDKQFYEQKIEALQEKLNEANKKLINFEKLFISKPMSEPVTNDDQEFLEPLFRLKIPDHLSLISNFSLDSNIDSIASSDLSQYTSLQGERPVKPYDGGLSDIKELTSGTQESQVYDLVQNGYGNVNDDEKSIGNLESYNVLLSCDQSLAATPRNGVVTKSNTEVEKHEVVSRPTMENYAVIMGKNTSGVEAKTTIKNEVTNNIGEIKEKSRNEVKNTLTRSVGGSKSDAIDLRNNGRLKNSEMSHAGLVARGTSTKVSSPSNKLSSNKINTELLTTQRKLPDCYNDVQNIYMNIGDNKSQVDDTNRQLELIDILSKSKYQYKNSGILLKNESQQTSDIFPLITQPPSPTDTGTDLVVRHLLNQLQACRAQIQELEDVNQEWVVYRLKHDHQITTLRSQLGDALQENAGLKRQLSDIENGAHENPLDSQTFVQCSNPQHLNLFNENNAVKIQLKTFQEDFDREHADIVQTRNLNDSLQTQTTSLKAQLKSMEVSKMKAYEEKERCRQQLSDTKKMLRQMEDNLKTKTMEADRLRIELQVVTHQNSPQLKRPQRNERMNIPVQPPPPHRSSPVLARPNDPSLLSPTGDMTISGVWECEQCTYMNLPVRTVCEMCGQITSPTRQTRPITNGHSPVHGQPTELISRGIHRPPVPPRVPSQPQLTEQCDVQLLGDPDCLSIDNKRRSKKK